MESFAKMLPQHANVVRDGVESNILAEELVLGDVVEIRGGDRVPADIRLLEAKGLKVSPNPVIRWNFVKKNYQSCYNMEFCGVKTVKIAILWNCIKKNC